MSFKRGVKSINSSNSTGRSRRKCYVASEYRCHTTIDEHHLKNKMGTMYV